MDTFTYCNPTKICFGQGQIASISNEIPKESKVLLIYGGGSIKKNGVYDQVTEALKGYDWGEFSGIEPNPQFDTLMKAVEKIKSEGFDYLLAVGGGSVIDGTKFIAAASLFEGEPWDICLKFAPVNKAIPLGCVLTIPATGSEANTGSVVSKGNDKLFFQSPLVQPLFAVMDPYVTLSLPKRQISNGVVDAFVHVVEQYLTYPMDAKVQDRYSEGLFLTLIEEGPKALQNPEDIKVRANIMWAASQALNGILGVGVPFDGVSHMIGHELTGLYGIDHARTLSIVLPAVMDVCRKDKEEKLLQYAERVFGITAGDKEDRIDTAIAKTIEFFKVMEVPTSLKEAGLNESDVEKIMSKLQEHGRTGMGERGNVTFDTCREILETAL